MRPLPLRKLKAQMVLKGLSLRDVANLAKVPYSPASQILNGKLIQPEYLRRISKAIREAPQLEEVAA